MRKILKMKKGEEFASLEDIHLRPTRDWIIYPIIALHSIWEAMGISQIFKRPIAVEGMVLNRCLDPKSKIRSTDWINATVLPYLYGCEALSSKYEIYRDLEEVEKFSNELLKIVQDWAAAIDPTFEKNAYYDITSSYFEGSRCILAKYGYSRDHRKDLKQIVIELVVTQKGTPFYWKVLEGNVNDSSTLRDLATELRDKFGIKKIDLTFDRGMVTSDNLNFLEENGMKFLTASDKPEMIANPLFQKIFALPIQCNDFNKSLIEHGFLPINEKEEFWTREEVENNRRYIYCVDKTRYYADQIKRTQKINKVYEWIDQKNMEMAGAKRSRKLESVIIDLENVLRKKKLQKVIEYKTEELLITRKNSKNQDIIIKSWVIIPDFNLLNYAIDEKSDGLTCFQTNKFDISHEDAINSYRDKNEVEEAFRLAKGLIRLRPISVWKKTRVKAHVSICMLAYLVINTFELFLKKSKLKISVPDALESLGKKKLILFTMEDFPNRIYIDPMVLDKEQKDILACLPCEKMLTREFLNNLSENLKKSLS
jgi:transposase